MPDSFHPYVDATGAARRLQALAVAGYGAGQCAMLLPARRKDVTAWRGHRHRLIHLVNARRIDQLYQKLWDTEGPSLLARRTAEHHRWQPFEAWTDATLDDPRALPFSDPEALQYLDWVKLDLAVKREVPFLALTAAEQRWLFDRHIGLGGSVRGFRDRYRPVPIAILRALELPQRQEAS